MSSLALALKLLNQAKYITLGENVISMIWPIFLSKRRARRAKWHLTEGVSGPTIRVKIMALALRLYDLRIK